MSLPWLRAVSVVCITLLDAFVLMIGVLSALLCQNWGFRLTDDPDQFAEIGTVLGPSTPYVSLRAVSAAAGSALAPVAYCIVRSLGWSTATAALAGCIVDLGLIAFGAMAISQISQISREFLSSTRPGPQLRVSFSPIYDYRSYI